MLTFTKKHTGQTLPTMMDEVAEAFRELRKTELWRKTIRGGVYVYEVTRGKSGKEWHFHVHVLVDGEFIKQKELSAEWLRITGDSPIVYVQYIHDREKGAAYVARYVGKPTGLENWNGTEIVEYAIAVHRRRLVHTFGSVHRRGQEVSGCEACSSPVEPVVAVAEFKRAIERGDREASEVFELLNRAFLAPKQTRESVDDESLRRIVHVGRRLAAERDQRIMDPTPPKPRPAPKPEKPPRIEPLLWPGASDQTRPA